MEQLGAVKSMVVDAASSLLQAASPYVDAARATAENARQNLLSASAGWSKTASAFWAESLQAASAFASDPRGAARSVRPELVAAWLAIAVALALALLRSLRRLRRPRPQSPAAPAALEENAPASAAVEETAPAPVVLEETLPAPEAAPRRRSRCDSPTQPAREPLVEADQNVTLHCDEDEPVKADDAGADTDQTGEAHFLEFLNRATLEELKAMQGIGDKSADQILKYRRRGRRIQSVNDLHTKVGLTKHVTTRLTNAHAKAQ